MYSDGLAGMVWIVEQLRSTDNLSVDRQQPIGIVACAIDPRGQ